MLDLTKPLYNDVFFEILYMDILPDVSKTRCELVGDILTFNSPLMSMILCRR